MLSLSASIVVLSISAFFMVIYAFPSFDDIKKLYHWVKAVAELIIAGISISAVAICIIGYVIVTMIVIPGIANLIFVRS